MLQHQHGQGLVVSDMRKFDGMAYESCTWFYSSNAICGGQPHGRAAEAEGCDAQAPNTQRIVCVSSQAFVN
jgi:hypothetical protein